MHVTSHTKMAYKVIHCLISRYIFGKQKIKLVPELLISNKHTMNLSKLRRWWRTGKPGMLKPMGLQRAGRDLATKQQPQIHTGSVKDFSYYDLVFQPKRKKGTLLLLFFFFVWRTVSFSSLNKFIIYRLLAVPGKTDFHWHRHRHMT